VTCDACWSAVSSRVAIPVKGAVVSVGERVSCAPPRAVWNAAFRGVLLPPNVPPVTAPGLRGMTSPVAYCGFPRTSIRRTRHTVTLRYLSVLYGARVRCR
jgi:hypothetical protein